MALTTPSVSKAFTIGASAATWDLEDTTDYTTFGLLASQVKGNFRLEDPSGLIHNNVDFTMPDTDPGGGDTEYSNALVLTSNNLPLFGLYSHVYSIQITHAITAINAGGPGLGSIEFLGDFVDDITEAGLFEIAGSDNNDDEYTVSSVSFNGTHTVVVPVEAVAVPGGSLGNIVYVLESAEDDYDFYFCKPTIAIEHVVNCESSSLQSEDVSEYSITYTGQYTSLAPDSISRTHKLRYPQGIVPAPADIVGSVAILVASPIYTKTWTTLLTTELVYTLPSTLVVNYTADGAKEVDVECSEELCSISTCIQNVNDSYVESLRTNPKDSQRWAERLNKVVGGYMLYSLGVRCGDNDLRHEGIDQIREVAKACSCSCLDAANDSGVPQQVLPISGFGGSGTSTVTVVDTSGNGISISSGSVGSTITYTLTLNYSTIAGSLAASNAEVLTGTLTSKFVTPAGLKHKFDNLGLGNNVIVETDGGGLLTGATKNTAYNKNFGVNNGDVPEIASTLGNSSRVATNGSGQLVTSGAADPFLLLSSSVSDVGNDANNLEKDLKTYTLPANTLATNNDYIEVEAEFTMVPTGGNTIWARMYIGTYSIQAGGPGTGYNQVKLNIRLYRTGAANQLVVATLTYSPAGGTETTFKQAYSDPALNLAVNQTIKTTGQSVTLATANQVVNKSLTVKIYQQ